MTPWSQCPPERLRCIRGVFTDIDDTLTTDGHVTPDAVQAMMDLAQRGITVIPITGRPIGWSEPFARAWPVPAVVAENGAVAWVKTGADGVFSNEIPAWSPDSLDYSLSKSYQADALSRAANFAKLQACLVAVERMVPGAKRAQDSAGRETDIAVDHSEFTNLAPAAIDQVLQVMQSHGLNATVSSIHINGWIGDHNKWRGACWIVRKLFDRDLSQERERWLFVGDSTNDQVVFEALPLTIGVANIRRFESQLIHQPTHITLAPRGAGFAEVAQKLLLAAEMTSRSFSSQH